MFEKKITLSADAAIPVLGLGTWQMPNGDLTYHAVKEALEVGYRHIDTAQGYQNEESVGRAIKDSLVPREDVFVTTKLESHIKTYQGAHDAFNQSLKQLDMDYVDLFIIHAPWPWSDMGSDHKKGNIEAWKAMEEIYQSGRAKAIGVSNFSPDDIQNLLDHTTIKPMANQISLFVGHPQNETLDYCQKKDIKIIAYSPLAIGYALKDPFIISVANRYKVSPAQLLIRYTIDKGAATLPKTTKKERMIENAQVNFEISIEDFKALDAYQNDPRRWE
jgi:diketogulonate reductase-like aldo/keto reductase